MMQFDLGRSIARSHPKSNPLPGMAFSFSAPRALTLGSLPHAADDLRNLPREDRADVENEPSALQSTKDRRLPPSEVPLLVGPHRASRSMGAFPF